jgi:uncharacterized metal-binding protein YceD (DUF177 family)
MPTRKNYIIQFQGLSMGLHEYEFDIDDSFFEDFDYSEIKQGQIKVNLSLLKQSTMMVLNFKISGTVKQDCDRCTSPLDLQINGDYKLIIKVGGSDTGNEDDDIITVAANEHQLDLQQHIYEYITLSLPIQRIHPTDDKGESTCDKEMLKKLEDFLIDEEKEESDPRWNDLKNIKLN